MLKIYDTNKTFMQLLNDYRNLRVETVLETGIKSLSFQLPLTPENISLIQEERYVRTADYEYVIKEVIQDNNNFFNIYCAANIEDLVGNAITIYDTLDLSLQQLVNKALLNSGWTADFAAGLPTRLSTYQLKYTNSYEMLETFRVDFSIELWYDTVGKIVHIYKKMGQNQGAYFSNELNLRMLNKQSNTYDYGTILVPIGKDNMLISDVNMGRDFLENHSHSGKTIKRFWVQEQYKQPELLKADAQAYLEEISQPRRSYKIDVSSFGKEVRIGDTIVIVDSIKRVKEKQRVVKIVEYPLTPERNKLELSNLAADFSKSLKMQNATLQKQIEWIRANLKDLQVAVASLQTT